MDALVTVAGEGAFFYYLIFQFIICICTLNLVIAYLVETLEIAVKNLSLQRADKDDERRQRREAEQWAKEMIEPQDDPIRRLSTDPDDDPTQPTSAYPEDPNTPAPGVVRTVTAAPTIEKRKKRIGVFEEDALKHAELHKGGEEEENSLSLSETSLSAYPGINEELTGEGETEPGAAVEAKEGAAVEGESPAAVTGATEGTREGSKGPRRSPTPTPRRASVKAGLQVGEAEQGTGGLTASPRSARVDVFGISPASASLHRESGSGSGAALGPLSPRAATLIASRPPTSLPAITRPIVAKRASDVAAQEAAATAAPKEGAVAGKASARKPSAVELQGKGAKAKGIASKAGAGQ